MVFDWSAEFKEVSLAKNLMSGPNPTNQIVGVLTRFCEKPVVIMGYIESMFHQVMVLREERTLLRFLDGGKIMTSMTHQRIFKCVFVSLEELPPQVVATMH